MKLDFTHESIENEFDRISDNSEGIKAEDWLVEVDAEVIKFIKGL